MDAFQLSLTLATLLCSLVAGFVFAFAVVAMPGIGTLDDREFLRAFQVMDGVIQKNQPVFMVVWVGSVVTLGLSAVFGLGELTGLDHALLIAAVVVYLLGVQLPTAAVNIPLNNQLQSLDIDTMGDAGRAAARQAFESRWNRWNSIRTVMAILVSVLLLVLVLRL